VDCDQCEGAGEIGWDASNENEIHVEMRDCEACDGSGTVPLEPEPAQ
jgi:DnaJ-class molecular chaperone